MHYLFMALFTILFVGCSGEPVVPKKTEPALDHTLVQKHAQEYVQTLYGDTDQVYVEGESVSPEIEIRGPVCLAEEIQDRKTQCSFTTIQSGIYEAHILWCGNSGCQESSKSLLDAATLEEARKVAGEQVAAGQIVMHDDGISDELLLYMMLSGNGWSGGHTSYHTWHTSTPATERHYYSPSRSYTPSTSTSSYSSKYGATKSKPSTTSTSSSKPSTSKPSTSSWGSSKSSASKPSSTRSSGWGSSSRSSGYRSSGGRRR